MANYHTTPVCGSAKGINRRTLITTAPLVGFAAAVAAIPAAAEAETPIMRLFRQREAIRKASIGYVCVTDDEDAEMEDLFWRRADQIEDELMALPCTCAADFAAKVITDTSRGEIYSDWETGAIWKEARALTGM